MEGNTVERSKFTNLKDVLANLKEIDGILENVDGKLNYLATNSPNDTKQAESPSGENATLEALGLMVNSVRRRASSIAGHTSAIVGS